MRRPLRWLLTFVSILILGAGAGGVTYSGIQIYQMNHSSGIDYLPTIVPMKISAIPTQKTVRFQPKLGDVFGIITIPRIRKSIAIVEGTDAKELKRGVGHFVQSVLPGEQNNSVLAGHRDSVFSQLGKVQLGDFIYIRTPSGNFTYEVQKIRIVAAADKTIIVPTPDAILTLSTCYPFRYFGSAPKRYIVTAGLIESTAASPTASISKASFTKK